MSPTPHRFRIWLAAVAVAFGIGLAVPSSWRDRLFSSKERESTTTAHPVEEHEEEKGMTEFAGTIQPILENHCYDCHGGGIKKGGLDLESFSDLASMRSARPKWKSIRTHVASNIMPPADEDPVVPEDKAKLISWIDRSIFPVDPRNPEPGQVTLRRLNRAEYANTIRDLLGVSVDASILPPDDSGYGFDNIGDVLSLAPAHGERYQELAYEAVGLALDPVHLPHRQPQNHAIKKVHGDGNRDGDFYRLFKRGFARLDLNIEEAGNHRISLVVSAEQSGEEKVGMNVLLDGEIIKTISVNSPTGKRETHHVEKQLGMGKHRLEILFTNDFYDETLPSPGNDRNLLIHSIKTHGPLDGKPAPWPESRTSLWPNKNDGESDLAHAQRILQPFLHRTFRRPIIESEINRYLALVKSAIDKGESAESAIRLGMEAALVSTDFLFRELGVLDSKGKPGTIESIAENDLASRLSYFLWSSTPDAQLMALAQSGKLRAQLDSEIDRMLGDAKSEALVEQFFLQWLQVRDIEVVQPDEKTFNRAFNGDIRRSMFEETRQFCRHLLRANRPMEELITADYTFTDGNLRSLYGLPGADNSEMRQTDLKGTGRRGILTHASVLTITSNPTRTSPVKRGKWVLDNLLDQPPPPPPPNVPSLESITKIPEDAPVRMKLEAHQAEPACASCHKLMDGIGYSFEHFDAIGRWREKDGKKPIDSRGSLSTGEAFANPEELISILMEQKRGEFYRAVAAKMLTFALGRGLDYYDEPALQEIVAKAAKDNGRVHTFVRAVVESFPFQNRRLPDLTTHN